MTWWVADSRGLVTANGGGGTSGCDAANTMGVGTPLVEIVRSDSGDLAQQPNLEAVSAQAARFLEQVPVGVLVGAKLSRLVGGFLHSDVLPQARRAADLGIDPTPLLAVTAEVLRLYADALHSPEVAE
jgi:hypothetical protein